MVIRIVRNNYSFNGTSRHSFVMLLQHFSSDEIAYSCSSDRFMKTHASITDKNLTSILFIGLVIHSVILAQQINKQLAKNNFRIRLVISDSINIQI